MLVLLQMKKGRTVAPIGGKPTLVHCGIMTAKYEGKLSIMLYLIYVANACIINIFFIYGKASLNQKTIDFIRSHAYCCVYKLLT